MQIKINTDHNIHGDERLKEIAREIVSHGVAHLLGRLTRIEVHLQNASATRAGPQDIRCMIEARPEGMKPVAVTHNDANVEAALRGGARKLRDRLDSEFGKLDRR